MAGRFRFGIPFPDELQQPLRRRAQEAAPAGDGNNILAGLEIVDPDGRKRSEAQFIGRMTLRQQRDAKTGLDQSFLSRQAVDRRPGDLAKSVGQKQRKDMRGGNFAAAGDFRERDPLLIPQIGKLRDAPAGQRMIEAADNLQRLAGKTLVIEIAQSVDVITKADGGLAAADQVAYLRACRHPQPKLDLRMRTRETLN